MLVDVTERSLHEGQIRQRALYAFRQNARQQRSLGVVLEVFVSPAFACVSLVYLTWAVQAARHLYTR